MCDYVKGGKEELDAKKQGRWSVLFHLRLRID